MLEHQTHFLLSLTPSFEQATPHANRMVIQVQTAECAMWGSEREKKKASSAMSRSHLICFYSYHFLMRWALCTRHLNFPDFCGWCESILGRRSTNAIFSFHSYSFPFISQSFPFMFFSLCIHALSISIVSAGPGRLSIPKTVRPQNIRKQGMTRSSGDPNC